MTKEVPRTSVLRDEELIARLQNSKGWPTLGNAAADRIEQLVATNEALSISNATLIAKLATCEKYRDAYAEMGRIGTQAVRDLEGKLAECLERNALLEARLEKAVEALRSTLNFIENTEGEMGVILGCGDKARAALARVKGVM